MKIIRRIYDWVLSWAHKPHGAIALFVLAFAESSFFPIPPDVLLIALCLSLPRRSLFFATITSLGSVLGGVFGYAIGLYFMKFIGYNIIAFYGLTHKFDYIQTLYRDYDAWAVAIAGFTPIPYKVFTITAGAFKINFWVFLLASFFSRSARFFIIALLIRKYGEPIKDFIDKYFNVLTLVFVALLIGGFILIKILL
ncbi:MAG: YqaA family protein [Thermodesulfobacteriota bacterium]|nr:MAG: YqaA family protein [Thermodesulfobacteriota bacterium]